MTQPQTCPRRMNEVGPWKHEENLDRWLPHKNGERVCSFCGSLHPEDFIKLCHQAAQPGAEVDIETSSKEYKYYIRRDSVRKTNDGAIKFYTQHAPDPLPEGDDIIFTEAVKWSRHRSSLRYQGIE